MSDAPPPDDDQDPDACPQCLNLIGPRTHWKDDGFPGYTCAMARTIQGRVQDAVLAERKRQDGTWEPHPRDLGPHVWFSVLGEKVGEVAKGLNEGQLAEMMSELVQVAATAYGWLEAIEYASQRVLDLDNEMRAPKSEFEARDTRARARYEAAHPKKVD